MEFFSKAFNWIAQLSQKLPQIDYKTYFIVALAVIAGTALIVALTLLGSNCRKIRVASLRVIKYLAEKDTVDDDNVGDFTTHCFSSKAPQSMRDAWVQFLGIRFGYPSDIVSEQNVFDKEVKKHRDVRANVFICIALVLVAAFAFWGYGTLESHEMGVIHCAGLLLSAILYLVLVLLEKSQYKRALSAFNTMQEDLDAKVNLQVERNFAVDSSPITQIATILDEIVARNTSKYLEGDAPLPEASDAEGETEGEEQALAEEQLEELTEETPAEEPAEETTEETAEEFAEESDEEPAEEPAEETSEETEEPISEEEPEETQQEEFEEVPEEKNEDAPVEEEPEQEFTEETAEEAEEAEGEPEQEESLEELEASEEETSEEEQPEEELETSEPEEEQEEIEETEEQPEEEQPEETKEEAEETEEQEPEEEPEVIYQVEPIEDEEEPAPSKLVKMPSLIDYMLSMNLPRALKINFATKLLGQYSKRKDNPEDKAILLDCIKKIIADLTKQQQA